MRPLRVPDVVIARHHKGFPPSTAGSRVDDLRGREVLGADFPTPLLVLRQPELDHNLAAMQQFCEQHALSLSPHVKTTMSPEIAQAQIEHGAWALTLATPTQLAAFRGLGADRLLLANELCDPAAIEWLSGELDEDPAFTCYCYADSIEGVEVLEKELARASRTRPLSVIVELGVPGGRTGARGAGAALAVAERVVASSHLELAGVGGFEGVVPGSLGARLLGDVRAWLRELAGLADRVLARHDVAGEFVVTAGGTQYPELVAAELSRSWRNGRAIRVVLRSGCYVTHDALGYEQYRRLLATEYAVMPLRSSLELWARVLSTPEPNLAIVDFGKRDTGMDSGFPVPLHRIRSGGTSLEAPPPGEVVAMNDQHAYFRGENDLAVGDRIGFGISHPCTTWDKWRVVPIVDERYVLTGVAQTLF
ncbi:type III PLP-dependent enzyme domain-containing protein [Amycolatopsis thermoflava]|uniref:D-serine deaminase-like pyridoxal phosphate-dependent protein n=1 Tax=Amycolatopsis thermoflava TaxID=84480 RepID=A0A3N2GVV8_9PSEU|nr:alanine racemase [Amycolatopsis thermoflava]ROS40693.1 D-serine deaminase-like pyridoxal phosphate-dependent protein [Amycolatopsis thermoflava]